VYVHVPQAGNQILAVSIDYARGFGCTEACRIRNGGDARALNHYGTIGLNGLAAGIDHGYVGDHDRRARDLGECAHRTAKRAKQQANVEQR
jgi:hypothetical protein